MKPTEFVVENSIIAQEADDMHRDHEVQMARSQMYSAAQAAIEIHRLLRDISEMEGLEGWVQSKLTLASQYLESVRDYMKYEAVSQEPEMMAFAEGAANYALETMLHEREEVYPDQQDLPPIEDRSKSAPRPKPVDREEVYPDNKKPPIEDRTKKLKERLSNLERKIKEQAPNANLADTGFQQGTSTVKAAPGQIQKDIQASNQLGGALGSVQSLRQGGPNTIANIAPGAQAKVAGMQQDKAVVDKRLAIAGVGQTPAAPQPAQKTDLSQYKDDDVSEAKKNKKLQEMATGGSSSSSGMATSMSGPARKSTSGVPKRVGNSYKPKRVAVGKGVYDK